MALVRGYQLTLSPIFGGACRYYPSCSAYAMEALERHGALRGGWLAVRASAGAIRSGRAASTRCPDFVAPDRSPSSILMLKSARDTRALDSLRQSLFFVMEPRRVVLAVILMASVLIVLPPLPDRRRRLPGAAPAPISSVPIPSGARHRAATDSSAGVTAATAGASHARRRQLGARARCPGDSARRATDTPGCGCAPVAGRYGRRHDAARRLPHDESRRRADRRASCPDYRALRDGGR